MNGEGSPFVFEPKVGSYSYKKTPTFLWYKRGFLEIFWFSQRIIIYLPIYYQFSIIVILSIYLLLFFYYHYFMNFNYLLDGLFENSTIFTELILSPYNYNGSPDSQKQNVQRKPYFWCISTIFKINTVFILKPWFWMVK